MAICGRGPYVHAPPVIFGCAAVEGTSWNDVWAYRDSPPGIIAKDACREQRSEQTKHVDSGFGGHRAGACCWRLHFDHFVPRRPRGERGDTAHLHSVVQRRMRIQGLRQRHANQPRAGGARGPRRRHGCATVGCRGAWLRGQPDAGFLQHGPCCCGYDSHHGREGLVVGWRRSSPAHGAGSPGMHRPVAGPGDPSDRPHSPRLILAFSCRIKSMKRSRSR